MRNYVLVTHGLLMRIFCMCYLRWTVAEFEEVTYRGLPWPTVTYRDLP